MHNQVPCVAVAFGPRTAIELAQPDLWEVTRPPSLSHGGDWNDVEGRLATTIVVWCDSPPIPVATTQRGHDDEVAIEVLDREPFVSVGCPAALDLNPADPISLRIDGVMRFYAFDKEATKNEKFPRRWIRVGYRASARRVARRPRRNVRDP